MPPSFQFFMGFSCCSMVVLLYLLYELIGVFKEFVSVLKEFIEDN